MKIETRNNGMKDITVLVADEGKFIVRKGYENEYFGKEISLGISHYIGGVLQNPPHVDTINDFTEVDIPDDLKE